MVANTKKQKQKGEPFVRVASRQSPVEGKTLVRWMKKNMFSSFYVTLLTLVSTALIILLSVQIFDFVFVDATWVAETGAECNRNGTCWAYVIKKFPIFIFGYYPSGLYWRVGLVFVLFTVLFIPVTLKRLPTKIRSMYAIGLLILYPVLGFFMLQGIPGIVCNVNDPSALCYVPTNKWGGLLITLILSYVGVTASLPIGIFLALGRGSRMPVVKNLCIIFIELWRGVPLITILFMASVVLPLFLPPGVEVNKLIRALIGIVFFESAYMAEVVRGGIQAIPKGQHEAADTVGFSYGQKMSYIVLPQALKIVLPSIVGTAISLVKDTSLVTIIGIVELLAVVSVATADADWLGFETEGYVFVAFLFWIFCYFMSRYSGYLERRYSTVHR